MKCTLSEPSTTFGLIVGRSLNFWHASLNSELFMDCSRTEKTRHKKRLKLAKSDNTGALSPLFGPYLLHWDFVAYPTTYIPDPLSNPYPNVGSDFTFVGSAKDLCQLSNSLS